MQEAPQMNDVSPPQRWWAMAELLLAAALVFGANLIKVVPVSEIPWLVVIGWLSLRRRGLGWGSVAMKRPFSWATTIGLALLAAVALQLIREFATEPIIEWVTGERADLSSFGPLVGNLPLALGMLALVWTLAAFGEEWPIAAKFWSGWRRWVDGRRRLTSEGSGW